MKKNRIVLFFLATCLLVGCKARKFDIQADMETAGFRAAESVQVQSETLEQPLTAEIKDGHFALSGKVNKPAFAKLNLLGGISRQGYPFILEPGHIVFTEKHAEGTPLNDSTTAFVISIQALDVAMKDRPEDLVAAVNARVKAYVQRHAKDPSSIYVILFAQRGLSKEELKELIGLLSPELQNEGAIRTISQSLK